MVGSTSFGYGYMTPFSPPVIPRNPHGYLPDLGPAFQAEYQQQQRALQPILDVMTPEQRCLIGDPYLGEKMLPARSALEILTKQQWESIAPAAMNAFRRAFGLGLRKTFF